MRLLLLIFLFFSGVHADKTDALKSVSLQLMWLDQFEFGGFYIAKEKGFYADAGLDVNFLPYDSKKDTFDALFGGKADFSTGSASILIRDSKDKKIVILSSVFQSSPLMLLGLKRNDLQKIKDIKGKKVMLTNEQQSFATFQTLLRGHGISLEDIQTIPHSYNVDDIINKKTDLMVAYTTNEPYTLKEKGYEGVIFHPKDYGFDFYEELVFTSQKMLETNPDIVDAFYRATLKGWLYAFDNIEETSQLIFDKYNSQHKSLKSIIFEGEEMKKLAILPNVAFGSVTTERLKSIEQSYKIMNLLQHNIDYSGLVYNPNFKLFSEEEKAYLWKNNTLKMCVLKDNLPFESYSENLYQGLVAEYVNKVANYTKMHLEWVPSNSLQESMLMLQYGKCDIVPMAIKDNFYNQRVEYSQSYLTQKIALVTKKKRAYINTLDKIENMRICVVKTSELKHFLKSHFPQKEFVEVDTIQQALQSIEEGETDVYISTLYDASKNLKESNSIYINSVIDEPISYSVAVRSEDKQLASLVTKIIGNIDDKERNEIEEKWLKIEIVKIYEESSSYILIAIGILVLGLLYNLMLYFMRLIKSSVGLRVEKEMALLEHNKLASIGSLINTIGDSWKNNLSKAQELQNILRIEIKEGFDVPSIEKNILLQQQILTDMSAEINKFHALYKSDKSKQALSIKEIYYDAKEIWKHNLDGLNLMFSEKIDDSIEIFASKNQILQIFLSIFNHSLGRLKNKKDYSDLIHVVLKREKNIIKLLVQDSDSSINDNEIESLFDRHNQTEMTLSLYTTKLLVEEEFNGSLNVYKNQFGLLFELNLKLYQEEA
ncbi:MAG TPA: hypothetical protein CFH84_02240 [Sulfurimonas sp. UBA12504]|nr:MAG: hypothetical protein A2019_01805 [Sulfurimonas sp. GWF2_37_8]DAB30773.1 MAG TPA: hypothetical protein CFH84_02240 [Sulfurimonas sp. UBA12504]